MSAEKFPWSPVVATGIGSLPGTNAAEAARVIVGELTDFIHLFELPARGPGSDMVGRTAALLTEVSLGLGLDTTPQGWRVAPGPGRAMRRARSWLGEDLDALEEQSLNYPGPVKTQVTGPWTLAASIEMATGERILKDPGACRDITQALAEAVRLHIGELGRRFGGPVVIQIDEPALPTVLAGTIGTASGLSSYLAVERAIAGAGLRVVLDAAKVAGATVGIHCCASDVPIDMFINAGAEFISIDLLNGKCPDEQLGVLLEAGVGLFAGSVPAVGSGTISDTEASRPVREAIHRLGMSDPKWLAGVVITPTCGMAGANWDWVRTAYDVCRAAGSVLRDDRVDGEEEGGKHGR
ncbi:MAG: methionine synthase [Candidatus Nanopelagicales bacterium]|nr:methionine synthase [Candidatus Nanopelagicales bacterium]